ncbi:MAG: sensor histidine kinase [Nocardioidaceae bacterium]|nr:sensor histidine kinase [Nocardioidaceae bacterium]
MQDEVEIHDLPDGVVVADEQGTVVAANDRAVSMLLCDPDRVVGQSLADVVTLDDLDGHTWYDCLRPYDGLSTRSRLVERPWYRPDGHELLVTGRIIRRGPSGAVSRVTVGIRNVRGRERLDRDRSDLVATVAHELRSPLTGVKGFTATLLAKWDRFTDQQRRLMLETVDADADRLARLITELLDTARIDAGRLALRTEPVDMGQLVGRVVASSQAAGGRQIRVLEHEGLQQVWGDADKLSQVVTNLIDNGQRHGQGVIDVALGPEPAADGTPGVFLLVDDEGDGVPTAVRDRAFTRFWRSGAQDGSGLGLYIVRGLVEAHAGEVTILDNAAGGARVRVWLPVSEPESLRDT